MVTSWWGRWAKICARKETGTTLALFRIAIGAILTLNLGTHLAGEVLDPLFVPLTEGGLARLEKDPHPLVDLLGGHSRGAVLTLGWAAFGLAALLTVGLGGRVTALLALQAMVALHTLHYKIGGGYDRLLINALVYLVVAESTATLSLDCRLRRGAWTSDKLVASWPRYLLVLQIVLVYTTTGIAKVGHGWKAPFDGVYRSLLRVNYVRGEFYWVADWFWLTQIQTVVAKWWEETFFVLGIWWMAKEGWVGDRARRAADRFDLRWPYLGLGVAMHVTLMATMVLGPFGSASMAYYLAFRTPDGPDESARPVPD